MLITSSTCVPIYNEPPPRYTSHESDSSSEHSSAPSYNSDIPAYDFRQTPVPLVPPLPPSEARVVHSTGLPAPSFAPGFENRANSAFFEQSRNIPSWCSMTNGNNARQFQNVARRRAKREYQASQMLSSLAIAPTPQENFLRAPSNSNTLSSWPSAINRHSIHARPSSGLLNSHENSFVVVENAAPRSLQLHRGSILTNEETKQFESRSWDFMTSQMADWEERERNWSTFRSRIRSVKPKGLGKRLSLRMGR